MVGEYRAEGCARGRKLNMGEEAEEGGGESPEETDKG